MADVLPIGFGSGLMEGQSQMMQQRLQELALQEGKQKMELTDLEIQQSKSMLARQAAYMKRMAQLNGIGNTPDSVPPTPQAQARSMADMHYAASTAAFETGMFEEAREEAKTGSQLALNASTIDEHEATVSRQNAEQASNLATWILDAKDDKEAAQRLARSQAIMGSQGVKGMPPLHNFVNPDGTFNRRLVEGIKSKAISAVQEADIRLKNADKDRAVAQTKLDDSKRATEEALRPLKEARAKALAKEGGHTKAEQQMADMQADTINDIDHMLDQLGTMENDPTGVKGRYHHFMEFAGSVTGMEHDTSVTRFHEDIDALRVKLSSALSPRQYRSKDIQELIKDLADLKSAGTSRETAAAKLSELRSLIEGQLKQSGIEPTGEKKVVTLEDYLKSQEGGGND